MNRIRCGVYTRKSTEEGLDHAVNSLDVQRSACEAYIASQSELKWEVIPERYDDGGYSGSNLQRPALERLLEDVAVGKVQAILIYKIDRLTRSVRDFITLVDHIEKHQAALVSITESFDTKTSLGRLTLNVLLSFAQFERELASERIRDKIAATKKQGIFTGGMPPLGYDVQDGRFVVNAAEAATVRYIFALCAAGLGPAGIVKELEAKGIRTKTGSLKWWMGPLRLLLKNKAYIGAVRHRDKIYPDLHEAIVDPDLFTVVQKKLDDQALLRKKPNPNFLLRGIIFDTELNPLLSQKSRRGHKHFFYYASRDRTPNSLRPIPTHLIDDVVLKRVHAIHFGSTPSKPPSRNSDIDTQKHALIKQFVVRVMVSLDQVTIEFDQTAISKALNIPQNKVVARASNLFSGDAVILNAEKSISVVIPGRLKLRGGIRAIKNWEGADQTFAGPRPNRVLIRNLIDAHRWQKLFQLGYMHSVEEMASLSKHDLVSAGRILSLSFLAPDIQRAIIEGSHTIATKLEHLLQNPLPISWHAQRRVFGFVNGTEASQRLPLRP